ncbi:MAG: LPS export ABC transporter permease LptG [Chromatiaceae bacterium]|nr:LPS export ABC transporter permease LptG [Candidatus Thioaporhodococcus sediminis]
MSILFRYLGAQILASVGLALMGLVLLFGFFDFINELDDTRQEGYTVGLAMLHVLLRLPGIAHESMPIAALIGALVALARLALGSEFTVMRASGLTTTRLVGHALAIGLLLGALTLFIGEFIAPPAERMAQQVKLRSTSQLVAQEFRSGLWAKDGKTFINIRQMQPDASLHGIRMYEFDAGFNLRRVLHAEQGHWSREGAWLLEQVSETLLEGDATRTRRLDRSTWQTDITPELLTALMVNPERMALTTLYAYVRHLTENRQKATLYEIALWSKLAFPLATPVMLLLALPFAYYRPRNRNVGGPILLGILIGLGFHLLNRLSGHIGLINEWPPALSALLPLCLFSAAALIALWRVESR